MQSGALMKRFEEYVNWQKPATAALKELCDPRSFESAESSGVDEAIISFVVRYLSHYLFNASMDELRIVGDFCAGTATQEASDRSDNAYLRLPERIKKHLLGYSAEEMDGASMSALLDIRPTATMFKELAFSPIATRETDWFLGVDLGAGTGITTIAGFVAAARKNCRGVMRGYEMRTPARLRAGHVLSNLTGENARLKAEILYADVAEKSIYLDLAKQIRGKRGGRPLDLWVSETFAHFTPPFVRDGGTIKWQKDWPVPDPVLAAMEPLKQAVNLSTEHLPNFLQNVSEGKTVMFPDIATPRVRFDARLSALQLRTQHDGWLLLQKMGDPFRDFEDFGAHQRWPVSDERLMNAQGEIMTTDS